MMMIYTMTDLANKFREDPWASIEEDNFPKGKQLYEDDERFFVAKRDGGKLVFWAFEKIDKVPEIKLNVPELKIEYDNIDESTKRLIITFEEIHQSINEQLAIVVKDVAIHSSAYKGTEFFSEIINRFGSWSEFLKPSRRGLSERELIGLWGEMYLLLKYFFEEYTQSQAITAWVGPERKKQDFTFNDFALEIKTTLSENSSRIKIASLEQLEKITPKLFLVHIFLNKCSPDDGWNLKKLYQEILKKIGEDISVKGNFLRKVSKLLNRATEEQEEMSFNYIDMNIYEVEDNFPGFIASEELHPAIVKASYELDPNKLSNFIINRSLETILKDG